MKDPLSSRGSSLRSQIEEVRSDQIDYPGWIRNVANGHQESTTRKQPAALNLRSHSLDKLRQIMTTGAYRLTEIYCVLHGRQPAASQPASRRWFCHKVIDKIDYLSLLSERWEGSAMMAPLPLPLAQAAATGQIWGIRRAISGRSDSRAQDI